MNSLTADQSEDPTFIHSRVDDLGLTLSEFRVYCHLKRRANHGVSWPGIDSIAKVCRAHRETIINAIKGLEKRKMVIVTRVEGEGNRYRLTKPSAWKDDQSKMVNADQSEMVNGVVGNGERYQSEIGNVRLSIEGNPIKENSLLPSAPLSAPRRRSAPREYLPTPEFEAFIDEYPRRQKVKDACKAWHQIPDPKPVTQIMEAVALQKRKLWRHCEKRHIPLPATWIRAEQWDDEL